MAEYFQLLDSRGLPVNVVQSVGHIQIRRQVPGEVNRRPTGDELARMQDYVREAMEAGAIGASTALSYPPAVYASTEEIAALCKVAGKYDGRYYTHMRNEGDRLLETIDEALETGASRTDQCTSSRALPQNRNRQDEIWVILRASAYGSEREVTLSRTR